MSDMQRNFDEQLLGKESETSSRLDNMRQKHECELSGAQIYSRYFFLPFTLCFWFIDEKYRDGVDSAAEFNCWV